MTRPGRLVGRTCLIVGGTGGIGLATAERFLEEGASVVVAGKAGEEFEEARRRLVRFDAARVEIADVTDVASIENVFERSKEHLGDRLDVLFHVAGISGRRFGDGPLHDCSETGWNVVMETNLKGMFLTNRAAVRQMRSQSIDASGLRGTVLNLGSVLGWSPSPALFGTFAYAASKGAAQAMTLSAAALYAPERIRFHLIAPGLIETPMAARACQDPEILQYLATKQPMATGPGSPADVAEAALFLCEPSTRFLNGVVLNVDGGWCVSEGQLRDRTDS
ncbi:SDR family oxidoreductase [soil metagenome]